MKQVLSLLVVVLVSGAFALPARGQNINKVEITRLKDSRCFIANGIPDHPTGFFPNRGNPNAISEQQKSL